MVYSNQELDYLKLLNAQNQRLTTEVKALFGGDFVEMMKRHGLKPCKCGNKIHYLRMISSREEAEVRCTKCERHHGYILLQSSKKETNK